MTLTLIFTADDSWLSRAIRRLTRSPASHVAVGAGTMVCHAYVKGVVKEPRAHFLIGRRVVGEYRIAYDLSEGMIHAEAHIGDAYDYASLIGYIPILLGVWKRNLLASPTALVCSEFVLHLDHKGVVKEWRGLDSERTTPADLLRICGQHRDYFPRVT